MANGLVEGVEDEAGCHQGRDAPSDDLPNEGVDDESGVERSHCGLHIGGVGDPDLVGAYALNLRLALS